MVIQKEWEPSPPNHAKYFIQILAITVSHHMEIKKP